MDDADGQIAELRALGYEMLRAHEARDLAALARMPARAAELRARLRPELRDHELMVYLTSLAEVYAAAATGRDDRVEAAVREFDGAKASPRVALMGGELTVEKLRRLQWQATFREDLPAEHRAALFSCVGLANHALSADADHMLSFAVKRMRDAVRVAPHDDARRPEYLADLGMALLDSADRVRAAAGWRRWRLRPSWRPLAGAETDLAEAVTVLERAVAAAAEPGHASWATAGMRLGQAYRRVGRHDESRAAGLTALRGHAWRVLLQSHTPAAAAAVGRAVTDAMPVAQWHVEDGDAEGAATALDAGRGLVLHSAAEFQDVAAQLTAAGANDLAKAWREHEGGVDDVPGDLRREVLNRLVTPRRLLDPPPLGDVRAALRKVDADALVYVAPGAAVLLPAAGDARILLLPELGDPPFGDDEWFADDTRDLAPAAATGGLEAVCDWAWSSFAGPVLESFADLGREPRLVLVPMGELARVPWHAARHRVDGRYEYAIERAVISYAASARLLCTTAGRDPLTSGAALVVADPETAADPGTAARPLPAARAEAQALLTLYPGARSLGRLPEGSAASGGPGSPAEILDWLAAHPGGLLHLGCHGTVVPGETSYLLLAGGERLTAEQLVTLAARPGLVVLAACSTAVSGRGHDEAFSLSTTFLVAGAGAVVAALWNLPDEATSDLMLHFHRALRTHGPADALRTAQLQLRDRPLSYWAGVVHFGLF